MYIIQTHNNIGDITKGTLVSVKMINYINEYFQNLQLELSNNEDDDFTLDQHGPIILLETDDDLHNLSYAGLQSDNLFTRSFEFVEIFELEDSEAYRMVVMLDNDFLVTFFAVVGTLDEEAEQWLNEIAIRY